MMDDIDQGSAAGTGPEPSQTAELIPRGPRAVSTLLTGRLVSETGAEDLCRIRNISDNGMLVETRRPIEVAEEIIVELRTGERLIGNVVWTRSGQLGVRLTTPVDIARVLGAGPNAPRRRGSPNPRAPRFAAGCTARMTSLGRTCTATVENLSQSGVRLKLSHPLPLANPLTLNIPGLAVRRCALRWNEGGEVGLAFFDVIPFAELSAWLNQDVPANPKLG